MKALMRRYGAMGACALGILISSVAGAAEPIRIGQTAVQSGPQAPNGVAYIQGIRLYLDEVNKSGGVGGRPVELVTLDDGYIPERARENARKLIEQEGVVALMGVTGTGCSMAVAPVAEQAGVPMVGFLSGSPDLRKATGEHAFHLRATYAEELAALVQHLGVVGIRDIGAVYQDDAFGRSALQALEVEMRKQRLTLGAVTPLTGPDYETAEAVAAQRKAGMRAVLMLTAGRATVNFIRTAHKGDFRPMLLGLSLMSADELVTNLGKDAQGVIVSQVVPHPNAGKYAIVREFSKVAEGTQVPKGSHLVLEGYMTAKLLVEGLRRTGGKPTRASLTSALESLGKVDLGDYVVSLGNGAQRGGTFVDLSMVRADGNYVH